MRRFLACFAAIFLGLSAFSVVSPARGDHLATILRRPIALAFSANGDWLYVANRDAGSISIIDLKARQVASEQKIAVRLSDLTVLPGASRLLALDEAAHELIALEHHDKELSIVERLAISAYPVSILVAPDGHTATIASLWSRRLTFVSLGSPVKLTGIVDLPFAPRAQIALPGRRQLLVAEAFGGKLALIDPVERKLADIRQIPGHNIRGLRVSPSSEMLLIAHQMLNGLAHSVRNDIHWGLLMSNDLRWLKVDSVLAGTDHLHRGGHMHPLGDTGRGGGDPGGLDVAADGTV